MIILATDRGKAAYTQRVTLDGVSFILELIWNERVGAWYLSVLDANGTALLRSRKLATNWPIIRRFRFLDGLPAGEIMAIDPSASLDYAGYSDLGEDRGVELVYIEAADLAAGGST